jgi:hypothetical protein
MKISILPVKILCIDASPTVADASLRGDALSDEARTFQRLAGSEAQHSPESALEKSKHLMAAMERWSGFRDFFPSRGFLLSVRRKALTDSFCSIRRQLCKT